MKKLTENNNEGDSRERLVAWIYVTQNSFSLIFILLDNFFFAHCVHRVSFLRRSTQIPNSRHWSKNVRAKVQIVAWRPSFLHRPPNQKIHVAAVRRFNYSYHICPSQSVTPISHYHHEVLSLCSRCCCSSVLRQRVCRFANHSSLRSSGTYTRVVQNDSVRPIPLWWQVDRSVTCKEIPCACSVCTVVGYRVALIATVQYVFSLCTCAFIVTNAVRHWFEDEHRRRNR